MRDLRAAAPALALALVAALAAGGFAGATEKLADQQKLACTACHDKPGSKLLTDQGKYFETMRTLDGYEAVKATFGECTSCHVSKPGSKRLTKQGKKFSELVDSMQGLRDWMAEYHPTPPPPGGEPKP
jgi:hypothetical protein